MAGKFTPFRSSLDPVRVMPSTPLTVHGSCRGTLRSYHFLIAPTLIVGARINITTTAVAGPVAIPM